MVSISHLGDYALEARASRKSKLVINEYPLREMAKVSAYLDIQQEEEILLPHEKDLREFLTDRIYKNS